MSDPGDPRNRPGRRTRSDRNPGSSSRSPGSLSPGELGILVSRLEAVAAEMGAVLRRAAHSANIKERADCSAALFDAGGELLAQAEHIPVHLGSMPASVAAVISTVGELHRPLEPGDQLIVNDPYAGGTHLNDITLVAPCFAGGRLLGWVANRAHHADVGGMVAGSIPPDASEIFQEGLRIPPVLLTEDVSRLVAANSRTPGERRGDLDAQRGANVLGVRRLAQLVQGGAELDEVLRYGERRMRAAIEAVPDGCWSFSDVLEPPEPGARAPRVSVRLTVRGSSIELDFRESDPEQRGNVNAVAAVTTSAVAFAVRAATDPTIPANGGALRPVQVITRPGTVVAASAPTAVGAGNVEVSQRVADVCLGALAQALPGRVGAAGQGTMNNVMIGGRDWVYYETLAGGQGGRPGRPGMNGVHTAMTNTSNTPVEALERTFPLLVRAYRLRSGSGGAGRFPGGEGLQRDVEMLDDATLSLVTERRNSRPFGLEGGEPGAPGENWLLPNGDEARAQELPARVTISLSPGDVVRVLTPGGGGYGAPPASA